MMLFKKKDNNTILKMFRSVTKEEAFGFDNKLLVDKILTILDNNFKNEPSNYYITGSYPNEGWKTKSGFLKAVEKKQFKNICHLIVATDSYYFSFENWLINYSTPKEKDYQAIEFSIKEKYCDYIKMENIYKDLNTVFFPHYAIVFKLPINFSPSTESKIKNGFFSYSIAENSKDTIWRQHIDKVDTAILKGIYPINFINNAVLKSNYFQQNIVSKNIGTITQSDNELNEWKLNFDEIKTAEE
ncbi:MAG: hypothetical protein KA319_05720, partial [Ferruginibacter sp.]|nr:hypothetical protein [Ferruginibacter sp.]